MSHLIERRSFQEDAKEMVEFLNKSRRGQSVPAELMEQAEAFLAADSPGTNWKDSYEALRMAAFARQAIAADRLTRADKPHDCYCDDYVNPCLVCVGHRTKRAEAPADLIAVSRNIVNQLMDEVRDWIRPSHRDLFVDFRQANNDKWDAFVSELLQQAAAKQRIDAVEEYRRQLKATGEGCVSQDAIDRIAEEMKRK